MDKEKANQKCKGCGHEAKSHYGFCWEEDEPTWCNKYKECKCKRFKS